MESDYIIREIKASEHSKLVAFIDTYWKRKHSLVASKEMMDFQHLDRENNLYHFVVGIHRCSQDIHTLIGYVKTSQYDKALESQGDYWGAIWKSRQDIDNPDLGFVALDVWQSIFNRKDFHSFAAIGISQIAKKIYKKAGLRLGRLGHYYVANTQFSSFNIAKNPILGHDKTSSANWHIKTLYSIENVIVPDYVYRPYKTTQYFINRFEKHPIYKYTYWGIYDDVQQIRCVWVVRRLVVDGTSIFRIVDVLGALETLPCLCKQIQAKLQDESAEYVDIMNYGIDEDVFSRIGFATHNPDLDDVILPNYFEPFLQQNVKIEIAYKADFNYVAFKADSDQDRPNIL